jgi:hypothetical protein
VLKTKHIRLGNVGHAVIVVNGGVDFVRGEDWTDCPNYKCLISFNDVVTIVLLPLSVQSAD